MYKKLQVKLMAELKMGKGIVWKYYLYTFLGGLTFYTAVLVPFYTQWGGLSLTQVQVLQSWLMIWIFILNIPTGALADHFGRKYLIAMGCLLSASSSVFYALTRGFYPFLFAEFISAAGIAFISGAGTAMLYESLKKTGNESKNKSIFGRSFAIGQVANILGAITGGIVAAKFGLNIPMLITAFPALIAAFVILTISESGAKQRTKSNKKLLLTIKDSLFFLRNHKRLRGMIVNDIFVYSSVYFMIWLYQPALQKLGLAIILFGVVRALFSLSGIIFTADLKRFENILGTEKKFLRYSALITGLLLVLVALFPSIVTVILAVVIVGGIGSARTTSLNTTMNEYIPSLQRATILSGISMANTLVFALMNPLIGFIGDHSIRLAFLFIGIVPLLVEFALPVKARPLVSQVSGEKVAYI